MKIAKSVKGIRKTINENKCGWSVYVMSAGMTLASYYHDVTFTDLLNSTAYAKCEIIDVVGNCIVVRKVF